MPNKRRRRRTQGESPATTQGAGDPSARQAEKEAKREEARRQREAAVRRFRRRRLARRALWIGGGVVVLGLVAFYFAYQSTHLSAVVKQARVAAAAAGCTSVTSPPDQGWTHLQPGQDYSYKQQPPTSGPHDPSPLTAGVYTTPQTETNMVHSLEHGAVEIYYQRSGTNALPADVVQALAGVANQGRVIMTPAPENLDPGEVNGKSFPTAIAFAAADRLQQCPASVSAAQAKAIAQGFISQLKDASSAPEAGAPL